jgi:hypothetical protein
VGRIMEGVLCCVVHARASGGWRLAAGETGRYGKRRCHRIMPKPNRA